METSPLRTEFLIIGAGLSGLHLAQLLRKSGHSTLLLEKSRGFGGRVATRRINDLGFDHGTPVLPWHNSILHLLNRYELDDSFSKIPEGIILTGGMNRLGKKMADSLIVHKQTRAVKVEAIEGGWNIATDVGINYHTNKLIIATPMPQARELLLTLTAPHEAPPEIPYTKKVMSLNILGQDLIDRIRSQGEIPGIMLQAKRGLHPRGVIFDGDDEFSETYFEEADDVILSKLHARAETILGEKFSVEVSELKKWRYSRPQKTIQKPFIESAKGLFVIGDSFLSGGVTGAISSAEVLAAHLV